MVYRTLLHRGGSADCVQSRVAATAVRGLHLSLLCFLVVATCVSGAWAQPPASYDDRPKITVSGEAVVHVKPDRIVVSLGMETWNADIATARADNNAILQRTIGAAVACGVAEKNIQTDHLSIEPRWDDSMRQVFIGYFVRNILVVTLSDPEQVEPLVAAALEAGVNYIHGIDFETTALKEHRETARELALKAAREKAEKMATVLGQSVGAPILINEHYFGSPWSYRSSWGGWGYGWGRGGGMSQVQVQADRGASQDIADNVALGKLAIRANVSVTFELAPAAE